MPTNSPKELVECDVLDGAHPLNSHPAIDDCVNPRPVSPSERPTANKAAVSNWGFSGYITVLPKEPRAVESHPAGPIEAEAFAPMLIRQLEKMFTTMTPIPYEEINRLVSGTLNAAWHLGRYPRAGPTHMEKFRDELSARLASHSMICSQTYSETWRREKIAEMFDDTLIRLNRGEYAD